MLRIAILGVIALFTLAPAGMADEAAEETGPTWTLETPSIWAADTSDAGNATNFYTHVQLIKVKNTTGPILHFACSMNSRGNSSLSVGIQIDPANTYEEDPKRHIRMNTMSGRLTIGDKTKAERFRYHAASTKMVPFDKGVPRRLFNAVVKDAAVSLKTRTDEYSLDIPSMDKSFKAFAKKCPVTNGGKFDESVFDEARQREDMKRVVRDRNN